MTNSIQTLLILSILLSVPHVNAQEEIANTAKITSITQLQGTVLDASGNPIANARVTNDHTQKDSLTNQQGQFTLTDLHDDHVEIHISAKNYNHLNKHITLSALTTSPLVFNLSRNIIETIDVYATPLHASTIESALPINVISSDELRLKQSSTLGDTLKNEVGVHSSYYGPVASSPIIRGLDGPRVLITQNGLDSGDASRIGPDHVVSSETSTAVQIEVLRGPATLFYGSGAIGGIVNVIDNRIPTTTDTAAEWLIQHKTVSNETEASMNVQTATGNIAWHLDAFTRSSDNVTLSKDFHGDGDEHDNGNELANSASESNGFTVGSSYIFDRGYVGLSYGYMDRFYGIPGHSEHEEENTLPHIEEEEEESEAVFADMKQHRVQLLSELNFHDNFINRIHTKIGVNNYKHHEIEHGAVGTQFSNETIEAKVDLYHQDVAGFGGAWTAHYKSSDFEAAGEEAFTPPSVSKTLALGWIEEKHYGPVLLQLGARIEHIDISLPSDTELPTVSPVTDQAEQNFTPVSLSSGMVWDFTEGYNLGLSLAYSERAPSASELFSFGPHIGTGTYEVGAMYDITLLNDGAYQIDFAEEQPSVESSYNIDITLRKFQGDFGFILSSFYNYFDQYYYQQDSGLFFEEGLGFTTISDEHTLPVLTFQQDNVHMKGIEAELVYQVSLPLKATLFGDYIHTKVEASNTQEEDKLPRIPPMRVGLQLNYQGVAFDSEFSLNHYFDQNDINSMETTTESYTMLNAHANYYLDTVFDDLDSDMVIFLKIENMTDVNAQVHSSFLKDVAPLPGRSLSLGIRGSF
tara:strand:+ start:575 stop:2989 length:2415 start_codon:yes stop_codon:yes gene_type:complete